MWGQLIGAGMNLLGSYLGSQGQKDPEYLDPALVRSQMLQGTEGQQANLNQLHGDFRKLGSQQSGFSLDAFNRGTGFLDQAQGLMSGDSPILNAMRLQQQGQLGDIGMQANRQQRRHLASQGVGGGGLRRMLSLDSATQMGEQSRKGLLGIQQYGLQAGQGFGQLGSGLISNAAQFGQGAVNAYKGARGTQQDLMSLYTGANAASANQMAANFEAKQRYDQQTNAQSTAFGGGLGSLVGQGISEYMGWGTPSVHGVTS